ncbi:DNA polymerase III subunit beta (plasmid) [Azospirillum baldaniorum]|uniref:Beta sliding clamp n=1 Tax=Azospirillum baldaniorum TaxID=1064539 RepID=A0A9P1JZV0_9PROT|nr:DNA polymerase III subunit beta [Azospirillum baldaniorum]AWJ93287.1 DNA polymerase III subunit beta [Azospirillum baldaniorum]TWA77981.1 DNA polymerase-3 subunit beta [Azospirillum brasilense]CCD02919.1 putative DNA polymerase III, beta-subunit [Azospirillum baldaniorum]
MTITAKRPRAARETNSTPVARLTIDSPVLLRAVKAVSLVVARSNTIPILSNVAIKADPAGTVRLWATDQDIAILRTTPADVPAAFGTTVGAKTLAAVLDAISPGPVTLEPNGAAMRVAITAEDVTGEVFALPIEDMPDAPAVQTDKPFQMPAGDLLRLFESVKHCISTEETRYYLNGIFLRRHGGTLRAVATDGHRMGIASIASPVDGDHKDLDSGVIIPRSAVGMVLRLLAVLPEAAPVTLTIPNGPDKAARMAFSWEHGGETTEIVTRLVDGTYPDYERVIPKDTTKAFTVYRAMLRRALKTVGPALTCDSKGVKLTLNKASLQVSASSPQLGSLSTRVTVASTDVGEIGFNARYVAEMLDAFDGEAVTFRFEDGAMPCVVEPADDGRPSEQQDRVSLRQVLMPMRV